MLDLPSALSDSPWASRARVAIAAVSSAGAALTVLRGSPVQAREQGTQLKTSVDLAAEGWVLGLLGGSFPDDRFLAEEQYAAHGHWQPTSDPFWTVDALDGTRSYVEGYAGFCVQVAFIVDGRPVLGVIAEPVTERCFVAIRGRGGHDLGVGRPPRVLPRRSCAGWPARPRFVDSTSPTGRVGHLVAAHGGRFVECGSIGLKACRVAADEADVYAKAFRFRLWDVAPVEVLLEETGCGLRLWTGERVDYSGRVLEYADLAAAPDALLEPLLEELSAP